MEPDSTVNAYLVSTIAVLGTLLGAVVVGGFQLLAGRRQLRWQAKETELRRLAELERWAHAALEDRRSALWAERRILYARLINAADAWIQSNRDLAGTTLPEVEGVENYHDAVAASPVVAVHVQAARDYESSLLELQLLGDTAVVRLAMELHVRLIRAAKAALSHENEREQCEEVKRGLVDAMRHHLIADRLSNPSRPHK